MENKKKEILNLLNLYFDIVQRELNIEYIFRKNITFGFKNVSSFAELLSAIIFEKIGTGTRGSGYDLINNSGTSSTEVKSCLTISSSDCKECKRKTPFVFRNCLYCNTPIIFNNHNTSRWGINAKSFLEECDNMDELSLIKIYDDINWTDNNLLVNVVLYKINPRNEFFNKYAKTQLLESKKSNALNFLPESFDFYKSEPIKLFEASASIFWDNLNKKNNVSIKYFNDKNEIVEKLPFHILKKNEKETVDKNEIEVIGGISYINYNSESFKNLKPRVKNLNKERGLIKDIYKINKK